MSEYTISQVYPTDKTVLAQIDTLLSQEGIRRDGNLDYICAMFDEEYNVIGTGSCFGNTLRCFAVSSAHQGEGLLNQIITHLIEVQCARGNMHLFLYTKVKSSKFFGDLGFYEIARVEDTLVFMENRRDGFGAYLRDLEKTKTEGKSAALVMNANPFTLGHQYLVEKAAAACDTLHLFVVSEDASLVPFAVRRKLVEAGVAHLPNVVLHDSGPYIISNATFPSYFLKDEAAVIDGHAQSGHRVRRCTPQRSKRQGHQCFHRPPVPAERRLGYPRDAAAQDQPRLFPQPGGRAGAGAHPQCGQCRALLRRTSSLSLWV